MVLDLPERDERADHPQAADRRGAGDRRAAAGCDHLGRVPAADPGRDPRDPEVRRDQLPPVPAAGRARTDAAAADLRRRRADRGDGAPDRGRVRHRRDPRAADRAAARRPQRHRASCRPGASCSASASTRPSPASSPATPASAQDPAAATEAPFFTEAELSSTSPSRRAVDTPQGRRPQRDLAPRPGPASAGTTHVITRTDSSATGLRQHGPGAGSVLAEPRRRLDRPDRRPTPPLPAEPPATRLTQKDPG